MQLMILTGASASGKTAIAKAIEARTPAVARVRYFDSIGVPTESEMTARWGSGEEWQRDTTLKWIARLKRESDSHRSPILFEGQMRIAFIREALDAIGMQNAHVILVDCDDETRATRLIKHRGQSELTNPTMMSWAACLRKEANAEGVEILDTTKVSLVAAVQCISDRLLHTFVSDLSDGESGK